MEEVPISLYLKLQQGERADLKVVSQAGIAFANLIEEMARSIDPFSEIRVEIVSGTEGSYDLNTITKLIRGAFTGVQAGLEKRPVWKWLVVYVAFRIVSNGVDWTQDKVMDWLSGSDAPPIVKEMSKDEIRALAGEIVEQMRPDTAKAETEALYAIVRRDSKIVGVGVSAIPGKVPERIVPQEQFQERSGVAVKEEGETRLRSERVDVVLVSPVLMDSDRRWKFSGSNGEFGAPMRDKRFLGAALAGQTDIKLRQGLHMDVEIEITEVSRDGVWQAETRAVTKVWGWKEPPTQRGLFDPSSDDIEPDE